MRYSLVFIYFLFGIIKTFLNPFHRTLLISFKSFPNSLIIDFFEFYMSLSICQSVFEPSNTQDGFSSVIIILSQYGIEVLLHDERERSCMERIGDDTICILNITKELSRRQLCTYFTMITMERILHGAYANF